MTLHNMTLQLYGLDRDTNLFTLKGVVYRQRKTISILRIYL